MSTALLAISLDADALEHLRIALKVHRGHLDRLGLTIPPAIRDLEHTVSETVTSSHAPSRRVTRQVVADDGEAHGEWLSPKAAARHTGLSLSTVDRAVSSGQLTSVKVGRSRRIHRDDLNTYMRQKET